MGLGPAGRQREPWAEGAGQNAEPLLPAVLGEPEEVASAARDLVRVARSRAPRPGGAMPLLRHVGAAPVGLHEEALLRRVQAIRGAPLTRRRPMPGARAPLVGAVVALAVLLLPASPASASKIWGVFFGSSGLDGRDPHLMHHAHVKTTRFPMYWYAVQPTENGSHHWGFYDNRIGAFACRGIATLPTLQGPPGYAAPDIDTPPEGSRKSRKEWKAFVRAAVHRYGRGGRFWHHGYRSQCPHGHRRIPISYWQIWNEPNLPRFNHSNHPVRSFAKLVKISHKAIRSVNHRG